MMTAFSRETAEAPGCYLSDAKKNTEISRQRIKGVGDKCQRFLSVTDPFNSIYRYWTCTLTDTRST